MVHPLIRTRAQHRDEAGALAAIVAVSAVMIFILAALVVDLGLARDTDRRAQNAADAAVLAAGNALYRVGKHAYFDAALAAAKEYAATNFGVTDADWAACTDAHPLSYQLPNETPCISFDDDAQPIGDDSALPTEIRVVIPPRRVDTPLAGVIGTNHVDVSAVAQMKLVPNAKSRCALCVVGPGPHDLQNGDVTVVGGDVHFNGDVTIGPVGLASSDGAITVEGSVSGSNYVPTPLTGQPRIEDPLAFVSPPDISGLQVRTDPCTEGPGIYGGYVGGCASALTPGLYVFTGKWQFNGPTLIAPGVTLYFTCGTPAAPRRCTAPGEAGGWLDASGAGELHLSAPTSGPLEGLAIFYDRNNNQLLSLKGTAASSITGTIYAPSATLDYRGTSDGGTTDALIVVGGIRFVGGAILDFYYDLDNTVPMPPGDLHLSR